MYVTDKMCTVREHDRLTIPKDILVVQRCNGEQGTGLRLSRCYDSITEGHPRVPRKDHRSINGASKGHRSKILQL